MNRRFLLALAFALATPSTGIACTEYELKIATANYSMALVGLVGSVQLAGEKLAARNLLDSMGESTDAVYVGMAGVRAEIKRLEAAIQPYR